MAEAELTFTNEDVKRLKERRRVSGCEEIEVKTDALLARLEAAEAVKSEAEKVLIDPLEINTGNLQRAIEAWRRSKGE